VCCGFILDVSALRFLMSFCNVCPFHIVVRGILDFIMNWCGLFEKPVRKYNVDETGFALNNKPLEIYSGKEIDDKC